MSTGRGGRALAGCRVSGCPPEGTVFKNISTNSFGRIVLLRKQSASNLENIVNNNLKAIVKSEAGRMGGMCPVAFRMKFSGNF